MTLRQYLQSLDAAAKRALASELGVTVVYLHQLCSGFRQPSPDLAIRIESASGGQVRCETLRPDVPWHVVRGKAAQPQEAA